MTRQRRPTITTVAEVAEVSIASASRALNGIHTNPDTRARVLAAAEQVGYMPHAAARSLRSKQSGLIAFPWAPPKLKAEPVAKGTALAYPVADFYLTNPIARSSPTLQLCSAEILHGQGWAEAAE